jgi:hypothetical protein
MIIELLFVFLIGLGVGYTLGWYLRKFKQEILKSIEERK